jgi:ABC-2 type transport system ATP-binding protein
MVMIGTTGRRDMGGIMPSLADGGCMTATVQQRVQRSARHADSIIAGLRGVTKKYGDVTALNKVDFSVRRGEIVALLGPNGAGKTTAVRLLLGLTAPTEGAVSVFGGDPRNPENRIQTGAMLQVGRVPETLKVREHIDMFSSYYPNPLPLEEVLEAAGLKGLESKPFGELSGGQRQRALFALAICGNPDLLFLDEPTVGLDVEARRLLWDEIRKLVARGKTVLLTTHYLQEADALANRIVVINRGEIVAQGSPADIKAQTAGKKIRCVSRIPLEEVRAMAGVLDARQDREAIEINVSHAEPVLRELLARDLTLSDLEVASAGLEEAFLALTQNSGNSTAEVTK